MKMSHFEQNQNISPPSGSSESTNMADHIFEMAGPRLFFNYCLIKMAKIRLPMLNAANYF